MKSLKKMCALVLALAMVLGMGTTVFAVDDQTGTLADNGVVKNADHSSVGTTLNIPKGITVYGSMDKVYGPTVTYSYSVAPVEITATAAGYDYTVTDFNNVTVNVKEGPATGVSLTDNKALFTSSEVTLTNGSAEITDNITVSIDPTAFTTAEYGPGVYRYVITDTTTIESLYDAGVTRDDNYVTTRYLDIYLKYNEAGNALEVYGYVLLDTAVSPEGKEDEPLEWITPKEKSHGFIDASETDTDEYHTIDVTLTKKITGGMGNKNHQFPFSFAVSNCGLYYYHGETTADTSSSYTAANTDSVSGITLADSEVYSIRGLNPKATISYTETNDTVDTYKLTVTDNGGATSYVKDNQDPPVELNAVEIAMLGGTKTTETMKVSNYDTDNNVTSVKADIIAEDAKAITFTNHLDVISPTGVVMRFGPYALILLAGIAILVIALKRRSRKDDDD